jgi:hypothetical protein
MPLTLTGSYGTNKVQVTSINQVRAHLGDYSRRIAAVKAKQEVIDDAAAREELLRSAADVLLDAWLMLEAEAQWAQVEWWQLDATEIGGQPSVESADEVTA